MTSGCIRREPIDHLKLFQNLKETNYFEDLGLVDYFEKMNGYPDGITKKLKII